MSIWLPFRVTPGLEFFVAEKLDRLGTEKVFVPKSRVAIRGAKGKPRFVLRALAPGYVFASYHGWEAFGAAYPAHRLVKGFHGAISWSLGGPPIQLTPMDVRKLMAMEIAAAEPHVEQGLKRSDRITIRRGRYAGIAGIVDRLSGANVIADVSMFGRTFSVVVPIDQTEKAA